MNVLTVAQARFKVDEAALESMSEVRATKVILEVLDNMGVNSFKRTRELHEDEAKQDFAAVLAAFKEDAIDYVTTEGAQGWRYAHYNDVFCVAFVNSL